MIKTGAQILWECLEHEGVTHVFGYPGGAILPAYDALKHSKIHHVLVGMSRAPLTWRMDTRAPADKRESPWPPPVLELPTW